MTEKKTHRLRATITFEYDAIVSDYQECGLFEHEPTAEQCAALDKLDLASGDLTHFDLAEDDWTVTIEPVVG